ncbi:hypothetical protein [Microbacterium sp. SORGH_AS_0454]|nr:hypothetical protein [Microbacterium sp. SORGH_AS_0454]
MTFPIDFHRHPKMTRLAPEVRWTFVEMNGEARIADNDGAFTHEDAEFAWPIDHLAALASSHPTRPLVIRTDTHYVIREFGEHQETRASREERQARNQANGAKGGRPRKKTQSVPSGLPPGTDSQANETQQKAESESESESEDYYSPSKSQSLDNRARVSTDAFEVSEVTQAMAARAGIRDLHAIAKAVAERTGIRVDPFGTMTLATHLLDKAKTYPQSPDRYVLGSIAKSPAEIQRFLYDANLAA